MEDKDKLTKEITTIFEEDAQGIWLDNEIIERIIVKARPNLSERVRAFMNKEVEIPVAPVIVGIAALLLISILPKGIFRSSNDQIIDIAGSKVIISEGIEVAER